MAKDRNTMAKRQRETEKRDKAARKRQKRELRQSESKSDLHKSDLHRSDLRRSDLRKGQDLQVLERTADHAANDDQIRVLSIFRRYLMTTGRMLCLSGNDLESNRDRLRRLVEDGLLVAESFQGGYSLTPSGFEAMKRLQTH